MSAHYIQVTIGAGVTQLQSANKNVREILIRNASTHDMRVGTASTGTSAPSVSGNVGIILKANAAGEQSDLHLGPTPGLNISLSDFFIAGTQNDLVDIMFDA